MMYEELQKEYEKKAEELFKKEMEPFIVTDIGTPVFGDYHFEPTSKYLNIFMMFGLGSILCVTYRFEYDSKDTENYKREQFTITPDATSVLDGLIMRMRTRILDHGNYSYGTYKRLGFYKNSEDGEKSEE
jgi:hypothetical protein